jgi:hypothetical protein
MHSKYPIVAARAKRICEYCNSHSQDALASWTTSRDLAIEINYEPLQTLAQEAIDRLSTKEPD